MSYTSICAAREVCEPRETPIEFSVDRDAPIPVVFIVNGDLHMRQVLHDLLSSEGIKAVSFGSAAEYRAATKLDAPACLILDVDLPDTNGLDLQVQVADAPVVFVTGRRDLRSSVRAMKAGAVDFLTVPLRGCDFINAVRIAIATGRDRRLQSAEMAQLEQRFDSLTRREREVLPLVISGLPNKQSARELGISIVTLQIHRSKIMQKMAAHSLAALVRMSITLKIPLAQCTSHLEATDSPLRRSTTRGLRPGRFGALNSLPC